MRVRSTTVRSQFREAPSITRPPAIPQPSNRLDSGHSARRWPVCASQRGLAPASARYFARIRTVCAWPKHQSVHAVLVVLVRSDPDGLVRRARNDRATRRPFGPRRRMNVVVWPTPLGLEDLRRDRGRVAAAACHFRAGMILIARRSESGSVVTLMGVPGLSLATVMAVSVLLPLPTT